MSLRTYPLISHPAFLRFIESEDRQLNLLDILPAADVPIHFPKIRTPGDIAKYLGVRPLTIRNLERKKPNHYRTFIVRKRSGGTRTIHAPRTFLKVTQWWLLDNVLDLESDLPFVFGFSKGKSFVDNARLHFGASNLLNIDIQDFFSSIKLPAVLRYFHDAGYSLKSSNFLSELTTYEGYLPQGAPTSPKLSNLIMKHCDIELHNISKFNGLLYSRYADDMTFSGNNRISFEFLDQVKEVLARYGFKLNSSKTKFMGMNQRKEITGLVLAADSVALKQDFLNGLRGWFHSINQNPVYDIKTVQRLRGTLNLLKLVGGRGSLQAASSGSQALVALMAVKPPMLEWGKD